MQNKLILLELRISYILHTFPERKRYNHPTAWHGLVTLEKTLCCGSFYSRRLHQLDTALHSLVVVWGC